MRARILVVFLTALMAAAAHSSQPGAVTASGLVTLFHDTCDSIASGEVALALVADDSQAPTASWHVLVRAQNHEGGCTAYALGSCAGEGTLSGGVTLKGCIGPVEGGSFGPAVVCYPGPARPMVHSVAHQVPVAIDGIDGTFEGKIEADLYGTAVDEPQNLCV